MPFDYSSLAISMFFSFFDFGYFCSFIPIQNIGKIFLWAIQYFQGNTESVFSVLSHKREDISTTNQYKVEKRAHIHRIELDNHGALTVQVDIIIVSGVCRYFILVCRYLILVCRHLILDLSPFSIM